MGHRVFKGGCRIASQPCITRRHCSFGPVSVAEECKSHLLCSLGVFSEASPCKSHLPCKGFPGAGCQACAAFTDSLPRSIDRGQRYLPMAGSSADGLARVSMFGLCASAFSSLVCSTSRNRIRAVGDGCMPLTYYEGDQRGGLPARIIHREKEAHHDRAHNQKRK